MVCITCNIYGYKRAGCWCHLQAQKSTKHHYEYQEMNLDVRTLFDKSMIHRRKAWNTHEIISSLVMCINTKIVYVVNKSDNSQWIAITITNVSMSNEEIIKIYEILWSIKIFFKTIKSTFKLKRDSWHKMLKVLFLIILYLCKIYSCFMKDTKREWCQEIWWIISEVMWRYCDSHVYRGNDNAVYHDWIIITRGRSEDITVDWKNVDSMVQDVTVLVVWIYNAVNNNIMKSNNDEYINEFYNYCTSSSAKLE